MTEVAKEIEEEPFDILDINMGCPVPKVVNNGEGSALLKNPDLIVKIVKSISSAIQKPLTVKVRIGFENEPVDIVDFLPQHARSSPNHIRSAEKVSPLFSANPHPHFQSPECPTVQGFAGSPIILRVMRIWRSCWRDYNYVQWIRFCKKSFQM